MKTMRRKEKLHCNKGSHKKRQKISQQLVVNYLQKWRTPPISQQYQSLLVLENRCFFAIIKSLWMRRININKIGDLFKVKLLTNRLWKVFISLDQNLILWQRCFAWSNFRIFFWVRNSMLLNLNFFPKMRRLVPRTPILQRAQILRLAHSYTLWSSVSLNKTLDKRYGWL